MILTCPGCTARFVIPRSEEELRDVEVTHPACGHAFAPFAEHPAVVAEVLASEFIALEEPSFEDAALADDDLCCEEDIDAAGDEGHPLHEIDTHRLRKALTQATTIPFRNIFSKLAAAGFASAAAAELVFLFDKGADGALPAAHYTLALLGMGR